MNPPNILVNLPPGFFTQPSLEPVFARLAQLGSVRKTSHNTPDEIRADLAEADAVIMWSWPLLDEAMLRASRVRYLGFLDVTQRGAQIALAHGVPVSISRGGFSPAVAEMALALALNLLRGVSDYHAAMRTGAEPWVARFPDDIAPRERELTGRRVGIVGFGAVGRRLAELLAPFRCALCVVDPFVPAETLEQAGATRVELPELLRTAEVIVLCAASNPGSRKMITASELDLLQPGAVFINVARAALVDTDALVQRLARGDISAAIDVFDEEPLASAHPLRACRNAYLTPHRAGGLMASVYRTVDWLVDDLEAVLAGNPRRYALTERMLSSLDA